MEDRNQMKSARVVRLSVRKTAQPHAHELWSEGQRIGTLFHSEDRLGRFWAWNVFVQGRFGGSSTSEARLSSQADALRAARDWLQRRG